MKQTLKFGKARCVRFDAKVVRTWESRTKSWSAIRGGVRLVGKR